MEVVKAHFMALSWHKLWGGAEKKTKFSVMIAHILNETN
jgi:hypothetical protein